MTSQTTPAPSVESLLAIYRQMFAARQIDRLEAEYVRRGEAFFSASDAGHEATAVLGAFLGENDWLHCHYRDKALMLARGIGAAMFFLCLFNKDRSHSRGRQMNAQMSAPELKVMSLVCPVGNGALQSVGVASVVKEQSGAPIVLCSLGDGMTQQGEVYEAIAQAVRDKLPVLFLIQDNGLALSTPTAGRRSSFSRSIASTIIRVRTTQNFIVRPTRSRESERPAIRWRVCATNSSSRASRRLRSTIENARISAACTGYLTGLQIA